MNTTKSTSQTVPANNIIRYDSLEEDLGESIRTAEHRLRQAIHGNRLKQKELQRFDNEYQDLDKVLEDLPKKLTHKIMVPLGSVAFMPGEIYNTNKVKVLLGENYFVKCTTTHARTILDRRREYIKESLNQIDKQFNDLKTRVGMTNELLDVPKATEDLVEIREDYNSDEEESTLPPLKSVPVSQKPKIEVISSKAADLESDDEEDENMRIINEYLRREQGEYDSDEDYFEQDTGSTMTNLQQKMAKQSLNTSANTNNNTTIKSALKKSEGSQTELPPSVSISPKSGNVVDQLPTIKASHNKGAPVITEAKTTKKGVSFADQAGPKKIVEKADSEEDRFVVNMTKATSAKPNEEESAPKRVSKFKQQMSK